MKRRLFVSASVLLLAVGCSGKEASDGTKTTASGGASDGGGDKMEGAASDGGGTETAGSAENSGDPDVDPQIAKDTAEYYGADGFHLARGGADGQPTCVLSVEDKTSSGSVSSTMYTGTCKLGEADGKKIYVFDQYEKGSLTDGQG